MCVCCFYLDTSSRPCEGKRNWCLKLWSELFSLLADCVTVEIPNSRSCHERNRKVGDKKKTVFSVKAPPLFLLCVSYQSQTNALLTCGGGIGEPNDGGGMGFNNGIYLRGQLERHRSNKTRCAVYRFKHTKGTQPNLKIHNSKVIHASIKRPEMVLIIPLRSKMMAVSRTCQPTCPTDVEWWPVPRWWYWFWFSLY